MEPRQPSRRFLAPGARYGDGHGYRNRPTREPRLLEQEAPETLQKIRDASSIHDEPECISPAIVDTYGAEARFYRTQRHTAEVLAARTARVELTLEHRIDDVERRAKGAKVDLRRGIQNARATLRRTRMGGRQPKPALVRLVEGMEARLDGPVEDQAA